MTDKELNLLLHWAERIESDVSVLCGTLRAYTRTRVCGRAAAAARDREETKEDKEKGKEKDSPHTPYKEKDQKEKEERKEETLAHSSENDAQPEVERERVSVKMSDLFTKFWRAYPRKVAKIAAERRFETVLRHEKGDKVALVERMCRALERQRANDEWQREGGRFIPHPATWLNAGRWEDEPTTAVDPTEPNRLTKEEGERLRARLLAEQEELFGKEH